MNNNVNENNKPDEKNGINQNNGIEEKKKNEYIKIPLKLIGIRLSFLLLSVLMLFAVGGILSLNNGITYYSIVVCIIMLPILYGEAWTLGYKEAKAYGRGRILNRYKPSLSKGFKIALLAQVLPILLIIGLYISWLTGFHFRVFHVINLVYSLPYIGFIGLPSEGIILIDYPALGYFMPIVLEIILVGGGYIAGHYDKSFSDKIMPKILYSKKNIEKMKR